MAFLSGLSVFVAQNIGAKKEERANRSLGVAIFLSLPFGIAMTLLTFFFGEELASFFEKNNEIILATKDSAFWLSHSKRRYLLCFKKLTSVSIFHHINQTKKGTNLLQSVSLIKWLITYC